MENEEVEAPQPPVKRRPKPQAKRPPQKPMRVSLSDDAEMAGPVREDLADEWVTDAKTGKRYKRLPATSWTSTSPSGKAGRMSVSHLDDEDMLSAFDGTSMDMAANTFLAHLQVPPDKKELERLRKEKAARLQQQKAAVAKMQAQERAETEAALEEVGGVMDYAGDE